MLRTTIANNPLSAEEEARVRAGFLALQRYFAGLALDELDPMKQALLMVSAVFNYRTLLGGEFTRANDRSFSSKLQWKRAVAPKPPRDAIDDLEDLGL